MAILVLKVIYLVFGLLFVTAFLARGANEIDPGTRNGSIGFKALVFAGVVALWPLLAKRWWLDRQTDPAERRDGSVEARRVGLLRRVHRVVVPVVFILAILILALAFSSKREPATNPVLPSITAGPN